MTAQSPGPDAVARDEVGEAAVIRTVEDARAWERDEVVALDPFGTAYQYDATDGGWMLGGEEGARTSADALRLGPLTVIHDPDTPHLSPQPDGDVRKAVRSLIHHSSSLSLPQATRLVDRILASGLVVPVGEVERWHEAALMSAAGESAAEAERDRAEAQVAAVRALADEWDAQDDLHEWGSHWESRAAHRLRAALDTAPASPTTDQRIEARQLSGEHVGKVVVLPDGTRGTVLGIEQLGTRVNVFHESDAADGMLATGWGYLQASDVVTLIGGEE